MPGGTISSPVETMPDARPRVRGELGDAGRGEQPELGRAQRAAGGHEHVARARPPRRAAARRRRARRRAAARRGPASARSCARPSRRRRRRAAAARRSGSPSPRPGRPRRPERGPSSTAPVTLRAAPAASRPPRTCRPRGRRSRRRSRAPTRGSGSAASTSSRGHHAERRRPRDDRAAPRRGERRQRLGDRHDGQEHRSDALALHPQHGHHGTERDLPEPADRGQAHASPPARRCARRRRTRRRRARAPRRGSCCAFCEPTRHGTHLPQDSTRKKLRTFVAAASRSVPSASTTIAPVPSAEPASAIASNVSGRSTHSGPRKFVDAPPGCTAADRGAVAHAAGERDHAREISVPAGTQNTPGCSTWPETEKNFSPAPPLTPWAFHHWAPRVEDDRDRGERLDVVHQRRPAVEAVAAGERRLVARLAAVALHALQQRGLLAEDVAAGRGEDVDRDVLEQARPRARARAPRAAPAPRARTRGG